MVLFIGTTLLALATVLVGVAYYVLPSPGDIRLSAHGLPVSDDRSLRTVREALATLISRGEIERDERNKELLKLRLKRDVSAFLSGPPAPYRTAADHARALRAKMSLIRTLVEEGLAEIGPDGVEVEIRGGPVKTPIRFRLPGAYPAEAIFLSSAKWSVLDLAKIEEALAVYADTAEPPKTLPSTAALSR